MFCFWHQIDLSDVRHLPSYSLPIGIKLLSPSAVTLDFNKVINPCNSIQVIRIQQTRDQTYFYFIINHILTCIGRLYTHLIWDLSSHIRNSRTSLMVYVEKSTTTVLVKMNTRPCNKLMTDLSPNTVQSVIVLRRWRLLKGHCVITWGLCLQVPLLSIQISLIHGSRINW